MSNAHRENILAVTGLQLEFAGLKVLNNIEFEVEQGSLFSIIGPNGAGKTSLFNCISGLYNPSAGEIKFKGQAIQNRPAADIAELGVGRTFQNIALFENLTVLDNLLVGRHHLTKYHWLAGALRLPSAVREEIEQRKAVEEIIDLLDLARYRKIPVAALPYGVLKRVELGRALATEPDLVLLDEPAAGLNQEEREDMARYILEIKDHLGMTQILIEHDMGFVMDLSDEVMALNFGTVLTRGEPKDVAAHPEVRAAYLGVDAQAAGGKTS